MGELSMSMIKNSVRYFELLAAIFGTIYFYKYKNTHLRIFLYLLWLITFSEFLAYFISRPGHKIEALLYYNEENKNFYNFWIYNILDSISFLVYYYIFHNALQTLKYRYFIKIFAISYCILSVINWLFVQDFYTEMQSYLFIIGAIFLIISIIFYYIELMRSEKILKFHRGLLFWISIGLLIYYSGTIPFSVQYNGYAIIPGIHELFLIIYILAITMYLIFTFGFIWSKKN